MLHPITLKKKSEMFPFFPLSALLSFVCVFHTRHPPARSSWSTPLSTGWSVTCGVYVSVCLTVYSELILAHSINLSRNRSHPTCPLWSVRGPARACLRCVCLPRKHACNTRVHEGVWCHPLCIFPNWFVCCVYACCCCCCDPELLDQCSNALCAPVCSNDTSVN